MKSTYVDADGNVVCPVCGAKNSFVSKRTGKGKTIGIVTVGAGALLLPKRLKCNGCGTNLKRGDTPTTAQTPAEREQAKDEQRGQVKSDLALVRQLLDSGLSRSDVRRLQKDHGLAELVRMREAGEV